MDQKKLALDYRQAGFVQALGFGQAPALILVDFVGAYFLKDSPLYASVEPALDAAGHLLAAARAAKLPVFHTRVAYSIGGADGGIFFRKIAALRLFTADADPKYGQICAELEPASGELVIVKQYASAFFGTSLASTLSALRIDTLIIAGLSTSGCVRATALDACQHGFIPVVVREAVGDRDPMVHEANLFDLAAKYADVASLAEVCEHLGSLRARPQGGGQ